MDNIFQILGIQTREDSITNFLKYAINEEKSFQKFFLEKICDENPSLFCDIKAFTRIRVANAGVPDMIIVCKSESKTKLIVIENKLKAEEGCDQTEKYEAMDPEKIPFAQLGLDSKVKVDLSFVFLTLFPDQIAKGSKFKNKQYSEFLEYPYGGTKPCNKDSDRMISDWLSLLTSFYEKGKVSDKGILNEALVDTNGLDGGYLFFLKFMKRLQKNSNNLIISACHRGSYSGRHNYEALFSKPEWKPEPGMAKPDQGKWDLKPENFHIHIEPNYNVLSEVFSVAIHYEINPYTTKNEAQKNINKGALDNFTNERDVFFEKIKKEKGMENWVFNNRWNLIANHKIDGTKTVKEVENQLISVFDDASQAIDNVLSQKSKNP